MEPQPLIFPLHILFIPPPPIRNITRDIKHPILLFGKVSFTRVLKIGICESLGVSGGSFLIPSLMRSSVSW